MNYYYYDICAKDGDIPVQMYKDYDEFCEGLLWNRDIAAENGDKVISKKKLERALASLKDNPHMNEFEIELNGAIFIATNHVSTMEMLEREGICYDR